MDENQNDSSDSSDDQFDDTVDHGISDDATDKPELSERAAADSAKPSKKEKASSSIALSNTTLFKLSIQMSRFEQLCRINKEINEIDKNSTPLGVIEGKMAFLSELWTKFTVDHESLGVCCRTTLFKHQYMTEKIYDSAMSIYYEANSLLYALKSHIQDLTAQRSIHSNEVMASQISTVFKQATLPEIKLPVFSGDSSTWPAFRDLFISLVHDRTDLRPVSKLYYLKTNLTGPPAQLLLNIQMIDTAYEPAWKQLKDRYDDPEQLIFTHIHNLFSATSASAKSPAQLDELVGTVRQNLDALAALQVPIKEANFFLVYLVSNKLDASLREAWEIRRTSPDTQTTLENLLKFVSTRARALESAQAAVTQKTQWPAHSSATKRQSTPNQTTRVSRHGIHKRADYPCDHCGSLDHYLTNCKGFLSLSEVDRYKLVISARLCFNCLGHHSIQSCNTKKNCGKCNQRHHTMIHGPRTDSLCRRGYGSGQQQQTDTHGVAGPSSSHSR